MAHVNPWLRRLYQRRQLPPDLLRSTDPFVPLRPREATVALLYSFTLGPPGAGDVVSRELTTVVDGGAAQKTTLPGSATTYSATFEHGQNVSMNLVDIDGAGNRSPPSPTLSFTAADTFPPPAPAIPVISNVEQV